MVCCHDSKIVHDLNFIVEDRCGADLPSGAVYTEVCTVKKCVCDQCIGAKVLVRGVD